jgi:hypothetical protein
MLVFNVTLLRKPNKRESREVMDAIDNDDLVQLRSLLA